MQQVSVCTYNIHGLPWSRNNTRPIARWLKTLGVDCICIQEAFLETDRLYIKEQLERAGYVVCIPRDGDTAWLSSGLVTAVRSDTYIVLWDTFCPYLDMCGMEIFSNKGFHFLRVRCRSSGRPLILVNTHTQSNSEFSFHTTSAAIRRAQFDQIVRFFSKTHHPVLIAGDLNCSVSLHPYLRFLDAGADLPIQKATFYKTGEDLDHVAWLVLQWAPAGCGFCDVRSRGPRLLSCVVHQKPWSDHAPVAFVVGLPESSPAPVIPSPPNKYAA
jgi:endonuclease/exonuclease/phosphatase family metal-dependent hydrolase